MFDTHPPFQIDGNFGATSGIAEMLLQSQGGYIELLPAIPDDWANGTFEGLKARGNFEIDAEWKNGVLVTSELTSNSGKECVIKYPDAKNLIVKSKNGDTVAKKVIDNDKISFITTAGAVYEICR